MSRRKLQPFQAEETCQTKGPTYAVGRVTFLFTLLLEGVMRVVAAGHGHGKAMGFKYRGRIDSRTKVTWFGFGKSVTQYRAVIERHYVCCQIMIMVRGRGIRKQ